MELEGGGTRTKTWNEKQYEIPMIGHDRNNWNESQASSCMIQWDMPMCMIGLVR